VNVSVDGKEAPAVQVSGGQALPRSNDFYIFLSAVKVTIRVIRSDCMRVEGLTAECGLTDGINMAGN
jgi:hypothetical protein